MRSMYLLLLAATCTANADDWPQWLGANRDSVWTDASIIDAFPAEGAKIDWKVDCGLGYAGPAVAGGEVFLFDYVLADGTVSNNPGRRGELNGKERIRCLDAATGEQKWSTDYDCKYSVSYPSGPRCTPTVSDATVVTLGAMGHLTCFDRKSGEQKWQVDIPTKFGASIPIWGYASHPLVTKLPSGQQLVVTMIGGENQAVGAFDIATGELAWKARSSRDAGYCAPSIANAGGKDQLVVFSPSEVAGLNPADGEAYWSIPITPDYGMSVNIPQRIEGGLLVTSYGQTLRANLARSGADVAWANPGAKSLYTCNSTPVVTDGVAYGCDINSGLFRAISIEDGKQLWETKEPVAPSGFDGRWRTRHATAFITRLGESDRYVLFNDLGELVLCSLTKDGYSEHGRAKVVEPTGEAFGRSVCWSSPAYADNAAFVRNDKQLVRVNLAR